jgi:hypothetical protein
MYAATAGSPLLWMGGNSFDSTFNRFLANLECYNISVRGNVLASGLQDNGNVYCILRPTANPDVRPWVRLMDGAGDGGPVTLIATGQLITSGSQAIQPRTSIPFDIDVQHPLASDVPIAVGSLPAMGISVIEAVAAPATLGNQWLLRNSNAPGNPDISFYYGAPGDIQSSATGPEQAVRPPSVCSAPQALNSTRRPKVPWAGGLPGGGHTRRLQGCIGARGASPQSSWRAISVARV